MTDLPIRGIGEVSVYVSDLDRAEAWYHRVLGLETVLDGEAYRFLRADPGEPFRQRIILFDPDKTRDQNRPPAHGTGEPTHFALAARKADLERFRKSFADENVEIEEEIDWPDGSRSLYVRDPDGNSVEVFGSA